MDLDPTDIATLLECIEYSRDRIRNYSGDTYEQRQEKLKRLDDAASKLRDVRQGERE